MYTNTRVFEKNFVCLITQFYLVENYIVIFFYAYSYIL